MPAQPHIAVIGAGAFGGWTALNLLRSGARVTLIDAWGPGNSRASSGGETRIIRAAYGSERHYTQLALRAFELWKKHEAEWLRKALYPIGVLWMAGSDDAYERASLSVLRNAGIPCEELDAKELARRWPQINFEGVAWGMFEPQCGYLLARASTQLVVDRFVAEGGEYRQGAAAEVGLNHAHLDNPDLSSRAFDHGDWKTLPVAQHGVVAADRYVFACGPWLGTMFPRTVGPHFQATRQEIFFFGTPAGDTRYDEGYLPVWGDHGERFMYGIPGNQGRGFKVADDTRGDEFDPTSGERSVSDKGVAAARRYIAHRFPGMEKAPLLESRVCQYENSSDNNFIVDRHPENTNVWVVGGGSGHGFKHGPAVGEMVARLVLDDEAADPIYRLARFGQQPVL